MTAEEEENSASCEETSSTKYGPLSLSDSTKEVLECGSLTPEDPVISVPLQMVVEDINQWQEESDFFSYKDFIEGCLDEDILLVLDVDQKYGSEYYICLSKEAREEVLAASARKKEEEHEPEPVETQKTTDEVIVTTEEEVNFERVEDSRPRIEIIVLRNEKVERRPLDLSSKMPSEHKELYMEILPESEYYEEEGEEEEGVVKEILEPIFRQTQDKSLQVSVSFNVGFSQTSRSHLANACAQTEMKLFTDDEKDAIWKSGDMSEFLPAMETRLLDVFIENASGGLEKPWASLKDREPDLASALDASLSMARHAVCHSQRMSSARSGFRPISGLISDTSSNTYRSRSHPKVIKSFPCVGEKLSKMITSVDWHPTHSDVFVASVAQNCSFEEQVDNLTDFLLERCFLYVWSVNDLLLPRLLLDSCDEVYRVSFNPSIPLLVAGGCVNGQLVLWDLSPNEGDLGKLVEFDVGGFHRTTLLTGGGGDDDHTSLIRSPVLKYCASSNIDACHLMGLNDLHWLPAGIEVQAKGEILQTSDDKSYQIVSCGFDGCLRFWDIRHRVEGFSQELGPSFLSSPYEALDLIWKPFHVVQVIPPDGARQTNLMTFYLKLTNQQAKRAANLDKADENISSVFIAGTEEGRVFQGDFHIAKTEGIKQVATIKPKYYTSVHGVHIHGGMVIDVSCSPFFSDIFYSLGDKMMAVWRDDLTRGPLFMDVIKESYFTAGCWSPTRPAVVTLGLKDGSLRVWDLLRSSRSPQLLQAVAPAAITTINTHCISDKHILAVGDADGSVHILDLPKYLWMPVDDELLLLSEFLEKEAKRVAFQAQEYAEYEARKAVEMKKLEEEKKLQKEKEKAGEARQPEKERTKEQQENEQLAILRQEYEEFIKVEEQCLIQLGYISDDRKEMDEEEEEA